MLSSVRRTAAFLKERVRPTASGCRTSSTMHSSSTLPPSSLPRRGLCIAAGLCLTWPQVLLAQVPFPPDTLINAPNQQQALAVLGATKAEPSGHLLLEVPEIALPGEVRVDARSELPGTTHLVVLRTSRQRPGAPGGPAAAPEKPFIAGKEIPPQSGARLQTTIDASASMNVVLLARSRGRWFYATRDVKIGRPASGTSTP